MKKWIVLGILALVIAAIVIGAIWKRPGAGGGGGRGKGVDLAKVETRTILETVTASGRVEPRVKVNISSNVMGEIKKLYVKEGEHVEPGTPLLDLDPVRYQAEVDRLEANVRMAELETQRAEVTLKDAEVRTRRQENLRKENLVSAETVDSARLALNNAEVNLRSTREGTTQARAALARARDDLAQTKIAAPQGGIVTIINAEVGEQVIIGTMNNPGTVIMEVADLAELLVEANVDETDVVSVRPGQRAAVRVDAIPDATFEGEVAEVPERGVQAGNVALFPVKIRFSNPDPRLRPGMTARVAVETERRENALTVPIGAVVYREPKELGEKENLNPTGPKAPGDEGIPVVYVLPLEGTKASRDPKTEAPATAPATSPAKPAPNEKEKEKVREGKVEPVRVKTGISDQHRVELVEGPPAETYVVTGPYRILRDLKKGTRVFEKKEKEEDKEKGESGSDAVKVEVD